MVTENTEWERLREGMEDKHEREIKSWKQTIQKRGIARRDSLPGVGVHERGGRPPLGRSSLQDLIDFIFVVNRHLLQTLHHHASLQRCHNKKSNGSSAPVCSAASLQLNREYLN